MEHDNIFPLIGTHYHHGTLFVSLKAYMGYVDDKEDERVALDTRLIHKERDHVQNRFINNYSPS